VLKDKPPVFAVGVDVRSVVSFVSEEVLTYVRDNVFKD
jgi:hypothetical protein